MHMYLQINLLTPSSFASSSSSSSSPHSRPTLVHFRGMVQDTSPSPEVYLASHAGKSYGWGLDLSRTSTDVDEPENTGTGAGLFGERNENLAERTVVWAVSIPGESEWSVERAGGEKNSGESSLSVCLMCREVLTADLDVQMMWGSWPLV
jgi:hypothetical protein